ncbi:MAG: DnaA N-terminal domain-containing protein, partial [Ktedonobacterales bacterium]
MDAKRAWQAALERVRRRVSPGVYANWFSGAAGVDLAGAQLTVAVPSAFAAEHLRQRFYDITRIAVSEVIGQRASVVFVVREPTPAPPTRRPAAPTGRGRATRLAQQTAFAAEPH